MNDESELVARARQRDGEAMAQLLQLYQPRLRAFVERQMSIPLKQKVDPEDILQEVSVSCVKAISEIEFTDGPIFDWVCQVARRRVIDAGRRFAGAEKRDVRREVGIHRGPGGAEDAGLVNLLIASITSPSSAFSRDQREFRLRAAIDQLPAETQQAIRLRYIEGLPTKEIADQIGKTDGAIRVMLTRAIKKLEQLLAESDS